MMSAYVAVASVFPGNNWIRPVGPNVLTFPLGAPTNWLNPLLDHASRNACRAASVGAPSPTAVVCASRRTATNNPPQGKKPHVRMWTNILTSVLYPSAFPFFHSDSYWWNGGIRARIAVLEDRTDGSLR